MRGTERPAAGPRRLAAALVVLTAGAAAAQFPDIVETVEVRVVNVDVVVTDAEGRPVRGLERADFELEVNGRPAAIDYFAAIEGGRSRLAAAAAAGETEPAADLPYLAIAYDGRGLRPATARPAVEELRLRLDDLLASTRAVMVVRQGMSLVVEQPLSRQREELDAALDRLASKRTPVIDVGGRELLMREIESYNPPLAAFEAEDDQIVETARRHLQQIRSQAEIERFEVDAASRQLRSLVRSLAGLPGRKAVLYLGEGLRLRPAEPLFRLWWDRYSRYAQRLGVFNIESEISMVRSEDLLTRLVDEANARRVSVYSFDTGGLRALGGSVEFSSLAASQHLVDETEAQMDSLMGLALATGGVGRINASSLEPLLQEMMSGFENYYSLGFEPREEEHGRIRVRLRAPHLRLRYLDRYAVRTAAQELEEITLATLLTAIADNKLEVGVEVGEYERQADGTYLVPVLIKVPLARLALVPRQTQHVGRLSFVIMARSAAGELSPPAHGEVPIEIANAELLAAMGRLAGYRLQMRVAGGEQTIAIGVRDEVSRQDATLRLVLGPRRGV